MLETKQKTINSWYTIVSSRCYNMKTVPAKLTPKLINELDELVKQGWYPNRSEAVRDAVRELVEKMRIENLEEAIKKDIEWGLYG
jgi:putative addiction module CopG family antidote